MNNAQICNQAHDTAEIIISHMGVPSDLDGVARTACGCDGLDPDGREGQLYQDRMIGHFINVRSGTAGR